MLYTQIKIFFQKKRNLQKTFVEKELYIYLHLMYEGDVAQLARALAWHARGRGFEPHLLHNENPASRRGFVM